MTQEQLDSIGILRLAMLTDSDLIFVGVKVHCGGAHNIYWCSVKADALKDGDYFMCHSEKGTRYFQAGRPVANPFDRPGVIATLGVTEFNKDTFDRQLWMTQSVPIETMAQSQTSPSSAAPVGSPP